MFRGTHRDKAKRFCSCHESDHEISREINLLLTLFHFLPNFTRDRSVFYGHHYISIGYFPSPFRLSANNSADPVKFLWGSQKFFTQRSIPLVLLEGGRLNWELGWGYEGDTGDCGEGWFQARI